jgi:2'-5' RNA ligase
LFLAVDPPPTAVADLDRALAPLRVAPGAPRWTPPDRWHVTLVFLGDVPAPRLAPLLGAVGSAVAGTPVLSLRLAGGGRFGAGSRPAVLWAGLAGDVVRLTALAGRLAGAARAVGLPVEDRPFRAHLTVGRWRAGQDSDPALAERLADHRGPVWTAAEVALWRSHLGADARYERVTAWPLGSARDQVT